MQKEKTIIEKFTLKVCEILSITPPNIVVDKTVMMSGTNLASVRLETWVIYLRNNNISPELFFAIAHELRHLWQYKKDNSYYYSNYKPLDELAEDITSYNLQVAEIDANAFASLIMKSAFGIEPKFNGLSGAVVNVIKNREKEIADCIK